MVKPSLDALLDLEKFSSLEKCIRVLCYVAFFAHRNQKHPEDGSYVHPTSLTNRRNALLKLIRNEQTKFFSDELRALNAGESVAKKSHLLRLYPLVDDGLIKVGGRLSQNQTLADDQRNQIVIPKKSRLAKLILQDIHLKYFHAPANTILAELRRHFWIVDAQSAIRHLIRNCVKCQRFNARSNPPLMGDLPKERITPSPPFTHTGVDFAGPFVTLNGKQLSKSYLALFVCFTTKAIHLELTSGLSSQSCTAALRRFCARRGAPARMYSDNGLNFVGTKNELRQLQMNLTKKFGTQSMPSAADEIGITWTMIPPGAPHFGGLWESGVKLAKSHLRRVRGTMF